MTAIREKIISAQTGQAVSFETMMADIEQADIVYVGEQHTNPAHHAAQLKVIQALFERHPDLSVAMEMFSTPYQPALDLWTAGKLDETAFLRKTHWYANWRFDYALYRNILNFIQKHRICLVALNIPFHIPPKIAAGGLDSLPDDEKKYLPQTVDLQDSTHRAYMEEIFRRHPIRNHFEDFYAAQCLWEDAMAESVVRHFHGKKMAVLVGAGHITHKFGIPNRAFHQTQAGFKTILPISGEKEADLSSADYLWIVP